MPPVARLDSERYRTWLERCTFPEAPAEVTCGVSGGADSAALAILAVAGGLTVTIVHVDHRLRSPASAAHEASKVTDLAALLGCELQVVPVDVDRTGGPENAARVARHRALGPEAFLGHTMDDQAETVLLQLMRGGGTDALAGIQAARRPLLGLRRSDTEAVCELAGYEPVDDPSNRDPKFRRNRIRHEALPLLNDIFERDVTPVLARAAGLVSDERDLLDTLAAELDPTDASALRSAPVGLARRSVRAWLRDPHPPDAATVARVLDVAAGTSRATDVGGGRRVVRSNGRLRLVTPAPRVPSAMASTSVPTTLRPVTNDLASFADDPAVGDILISEDDLAARVSELGARIAEDYAGKSPLLVCVLKGAVLFAADLARQIDLPLELDFMAVSSYGSATRSSGVVRIIKDLDIDIGGRDVILVEDIIDSGLTLTYLRKTLMARQPASLEVVSLLVRDERDDIDDLVRYIGFRLPPDFVLGYGLDVAQRYRNIRDIRSYVAPE